MNGPFDRAQIRDRSHLLGDLIHYSRPLAVICGPAPPAEPTGHVTPRRLHRPPLRGAASDRRTPLGREVEAEQIHAGHSPTWCRCRVLACGGPRAGVSDFRSYCCLVFAIQSVCSATALIWLATVIVRRTYVELAVRSVFDL